MILSELYQPVEEDSKGRKISQNLYNAIEVNSEFDLSCMYIATHDKVKNGLSAVSNNLEAFAYNFYPQQFKNPIVGWCFGRKLSGYVNYWMDMSFGKGEFNRPKFGSSGNTEIRVVSDININEYALRGISLYCYDPDNIGSDLRPVFLGNKDFAYLLENPDKLCRVGGLGTMYKFTDQSNENLQPTMMINGKVTGFIAPYALFTDNSKYGVQCNYMTGAQNGAWSSSDTNYANDFNWVNYDTPDRFLEAVPTGLTYNIQDGRLANGEKFFENDVCVAYYRKDFAWRCDAVEWYYKVSWVLELIASMGVYVQTTNTKYNSLDELIDSGNCYLGEMNSNGVSTGRFLHERADIENAYNYQINTDDSPVDPYPGGGGADDEESEYRGAAWVGSDSVSIDNGFSYRTMTPRQLSDFRFIIYRLKNYRISYAIYNENAIAAGVQPEYIDSNWKEAFPTLADYTAYIYDQYGYGADPINAIVSLTAFPCSIESGDSAAINHIGAETLYIRVQNGEAAGETTYINVPFFDPNAELIGVTTEYPEVTKDAYTKTLCNTVIAHPKDYNDFRAYAPYTRLELYIPMHGTIDLDPAVVIGKTLTVKISVTVADGSSVATVLINGSIYQTINGQVGYSIPLSAEASSINNLALKTLSAQGQSQRLNAVGNLIHGLSSFAGSIASGNYGGAAGSVVDTILTGQQNAITNQTVKYQIEHATDGKVVVGQPTSLNAFLVHPKCQLIWHLPLMQGFDHTVYSKTVGYKCHKTATLGSLSGYTECSNAVLDGVSCTEAEKAIILEKLKSGIII